MKRKIVVFECDEREDGKPKLDFRLVRASLPAESTPLAIADRDGFRVICGQWFDKEEVAAYAEQHSGYKSEPEDDPIDDLIRELYDLRYRLRELRQ